MARDPHDVNNEGGPAFPVSIAGTGDNGWHGMSLRDWFAGRAISGVLAGGDDFESADWANCAEFAYMLADAMMAARNKT